MPFVLMIAESPEVKVNRGGGHTVFQPPRIVSRTLGSGPSNPFFQAFCFEPTCAFWWPCASFLLGRLDFICQELHLVLTKRLFHFILASVIETRLFCYDTKANL